MSWFKTTFFSWPVERKLNKARAHLAVKSYNHALDDLEGLDTPEAEDLRGQATAGMIQLNLQEWRARMASGEQSEASSALGRAKSFGATAEDTEAYRTAKSWDTQPPLVAARPRPRA